MTIVLKNSKWLYPLKVSIKIIILIATLPNIIKRIVVSNAFSWLNPGTSSIVSSKTKQTTRKMSQFLRITNLLFYKAYYEQASTFFLKLFSLSSRTHLSLEKSDDIDFPLLESTNINFTYFCFWSVFSGIFYSLYSAIFWSGYGSPTCTFNYRN
jgi:hypothetical protein